jgi:hypothetical protein
VRSEQTDVEKLIIDSESQQRKRNAGVRLAEI